MNNLENKKETVEIKKEIESLEALMYKPNFWDNKKEAEEVIQKIKNLKIALEGGNALDAGGAVLNIFAGAGGDDSEDWARMLLNMYLKYFEKKNWQIEFLDENKNENGGYRNISLEIMGKNIYGTLKNESGVHRLVRISPFNANGKRHTSFAMVEILPILPKLEFERFKENIKGEDILIDTTKSSGPGGQNVNKRETAVRVSHKPTNISVFISNERSQEQNKEKALAILYSKLFKLEEENRKKELEGKQISKTVEIEWGNQIRNYILHPYKLIKDLRSGIETNNVDKVLLKGDLEEFL